MRLFIAASTVLPLIGFAQALPSTFCQESHQVVAGETCRTIAAKYDYTQAEIQQWNQKVNSQFNCDNIHVGDSICVKYSGMDKRGEKTDKKPTRTTDVKKPKVPTPTPKHSKKLTKKLTKKPINKRSVKKHESKNHKKAPTPTPSPSPLPKDKKPIDKREEKHGHKPEKPAPSPSPSPPAPKDKKSINKRSTKKHESVKPKKDHKSKPVTTKAAPKKNGDGKDTTTTKKN